MVTLQQRYELMLPEQAGDRPKFFASFFQKRSAFLP